MQPIFCGNSVLQISVLKSDQNLLSVTATILSEMLASE